MGMHLKDKIKEAILEDYVGMDDATVEEAAQKMFDLFDKEYVDHTDNDEVLPITWVTLKTPVKKEGTNV